MEKPLAPAAAHDPRGTRHKHLDLVTLLAVQQLFPLCEAAAPSASIVQNEEEINRKT